MAIRTNAFLCGASEADFCCSVTLRGIGKERLKETFARDASLSLTGARPRKNVRGNERSRAGRWIDSASCLNLIFFFFYKHVAIDTHSFYSVYSSYSTNVQRIRRHNTHMLEQNKAVWAH